MTDSTSSGMTIGEKLAIVRRFFGGFEARDGYHMRHLSPGQKGAITKKYNALVAFERAAIRSPDVKWLPTRARSAESIARVRALGPGAEIGYPKGLRGWALISAPQGIDAVGITKRGEAEVFGAGPKGQRVRMVHIPIDPMIMASDPAGVAAKVLAAHPGASGFSMRAGEYGWARSPNLRLAVIPEGLRAMIYDTLYKYGADLPPPYPGHGPSAMRADEYSTKWEPRDLTPDNPNSNHFTNWATGIVAFYMPTGYDIGAFMAYAREQAAERRKLNARARQRSQREKLKGRQG